MPRTCTICQHRERIAIEEALVLGESLRSIANRFDTSHTAIVRHKQNCVAAVLAEAETTREVESAEQILEKLSGLQVHLARLLQKAEREKSFGAAVAACRESARVLALLGQLRASSEESRLMIGESQVLSSGFVDQVMERAAEIRRGKVRCESCRGLGWRSPVERPPLLLEAPAENGLSSD